MLLINAAGYAAGCKAYYKAGSAAVRLLCEGFAPQIAKSQRKTPPHVLLHHVERDRSPFLPLSPFSAPLHLVLSGGAKAHTVKLGGEHLGAVV